MQRSPGILPCDCAQWLRGWLTVHPWTGSQLARIPASHPSGLFSATAPLHRGPIHCASCAAKTKRTSAEFMHARSGCLALRGRCPADEGSGCCFWLASLWRAGSALPGSRKRWRQGAGKARRVGARDRAQFAASTRRCCQRTPGALPRSRRTGVRRPPLWGGLSLGYFSLATQREVTRSPQASESLCFYPKNAPRSDAKKSEKQSHWVPARTKSGQSWACRRAGTTMQKFEPCRKASRLKALLRRNQSDWNRGQSLAAGE